MRLVHAKTWLNPQWQIFAADRACAVTPEILIFVSQYWNFVKTNWIMLTTVYFVQYSGNRHILVSALLSYIQIIPCSSLYHMYVSVQKLFTRNCFNRLYLKKISTHIRSLIRLVYLTFESQLRLHLKIFSTHIRRLKR